MTRQGYVPVLAVCMYPLSFFHKNTLPRKYYRSHLPSPCPPPKRHIVCIQQVTEKTYDTRYHHHLTLQIAPQRGGLKRRGQRLEEVTK